MADMVIGKSMSKAYIWQASFLENGLASLSEKRKGKMDIDFPIDRDMNHPYRSPPRMEKKVNKRRKPNQLPGAAEIVLCVVNLNLAGFSGEFLSRNLPESHFSCSGFFCGLGFFVLAAFFGYRGWIKSVHSLSRLRR